jgi:RND family efflux transporter MFP subunit
MKRISTLGAGAVLALSMSGCVDRAAQQQAKRTEGIVTSNVQTVSTATPTVEPMSDTREITGQITTSEDSNVGPKAGGKIVSVLVNDGDPVTAGQLIAVQDTTLLMPQEREALAAVAEAQAQVSSADSALQQAIQNATYGPQKSSAAVRQANAMVRSAQADLRKMLAGARPQERLQTEATLASAKSNLETQDKELSRIKTLVQQGALAGTKLDAQQALYDSAKATYDSAFQAVRLQQIGNRQEDIDSAKEALKEAQENQKTALASKQLDSLYQDQIDAAKAGVANAKAQVENAKAQVAVANQALADAEIRAPFSGRVSGKPVQPGTVLASGGTVARIIGREGIYFDGQVPSDIIDQLKVGDEAKVNIDAAPGKQFIGRIVAMNPLGSSFGRQFSVRTQLEGDVSALKPGMYARGVVVLRTVKDATVLPLSVIVNKGGQSVVFTVDNGKAHQIPVTLGLTKGDLVQVTGIPEKAQVVVRGQTSLIEGTQVKVESNVAAAPTAGGTVGG